MFKSVFRPIPDTRHEFKGNEVPICQRDIRAIAQVYGEEAAETSRFAVQLIRLNGGVNPNTIDVVFPEGVDGPLDEDAWFKVVGSLAVWYELNR